MKLYNSLKRMSASVFSCALILGISTVARADAPVDVLTASPHFQNIPWGTPADGLKAIMAGNGYTFDAKASARDPFHDLWFHGQTQGTDSEVVDYLDPQRKLIKVSVTLLPKEELNTQAVYDEEVDVLMQQYGFPTTKDASYQAPYTGDPTDFVPAIKDGKAKFVQQWLGTAGNTYAVYIRVEKNLTVSVNYESNDWVAEYHRREAQVQSGSLGGASKVEEVPTAR